MGRTNPLTGDGEPGRACGPPRTLAEELAGYDGPEGWAGDREPTKGADLPPGAGLPMFDEHVSRQPPPPARAPWVLVLTPGGSFVEYVEARPCLVVRLLHRVVRGWRYVPASAPQPHQFGA